MSIRKQIEEREFNILSPYATKALETKGREKKEESCEYRTDFQRDRDRILHCKSFRRLIHKTQVFLSPEGDHYTTRLTHSLEVSQVAKTIARALDLNEDLTEAIALGHDLGHTPFGHTGEEVLNDITPFGFRHYEQSVRVVKKLEKGGKGLNLTYEVLDGIEKHTNGVAETLEGQAVKFADKIAYMNHDFDDAVRAGILKEDELPYEVRAELGRTKSQRITSFIRSLVKNSDSVIKFDNLTQKLFWEFREFMFANVYTNPTAKIEEEKAKHVVTCLYKYFLKHTEKLPVEFQNICYVDGVERAVCDYISGMSDRFASNLYLEIFIPKSWEISF